MTDRIDHAAEAREFLEASQLVASQHELPAATLAVQHAQVQATLALVEQQRIANLTALARVEVENTSTPTDALDAIYRRDETGQRTRLYTRPDIAAALGIDAEGETDEA